MAAAIKKLEESSSNPQPIVIQNYTKDITSSEKLKELEDSSKVASLVGNLMEFEKEIQSEINSFKVRM